MKNPLSYQSTDYDCGPTTLINAMSYLFKREDIPPDVVRHIVMYCLDAYNDKGELGKNGTSCFAMRFLSSWLNEFGRVKKFPVHCEYLTGAEVYIGKNSRITGGLQQGGAIVVRLRCDGWHYSLITGIEDGVVLMFDPYYRVRPFKDPRAEIVTNEPLRYNRRVAWDMFNSTGSGYYALGPEALREAVVIFNQSTRKTAARTIEYFI